MSLSPELLFREHIKTRLCVDPGSVILDGKVHRFATSQKVGDLSGWYIGFGDGIPTGKFGCWRTLQEGESWCAKDISTLNQAERQAHLARMQNAAKLRNEERVLVQAEAALRAHTIWSEAQPANKYHPYLKAKGVSPHGVKVSRDDLVVPVRIGDKLTSLQFIKTDGGKKFLTGGATAGGYFSMGKPENLLVVCEGFATGASIHEATGYAVAVAFNAVNLEAVAKSLRGKFPDAKIIIGADDDFKTEGNTGLIKAKEAANAVGGVVAIPSFKEDRSEKDTDFNDMARLYGLAAVKAVFDTILASPVSKSNLVSGACHITEIDRLAALDPIAYDIQREAVAKTLSVRVSTLDQEVKKARESLLNDKRDGFFNIIEPWPEPVDGAELLDNVCDTIARFIICEPETRVAATLWIALTWLIDVVQVAPLAIITAPEKRCGKTQFLDLMGRLSRSPLVASSISPAAVYRVIEAHRPTLLIDEADSFMKDNEELRGVINSGHTRTSAYVIRTVGDDHEPRQFSTWGAKVLCGIGTLPETLMDRAIILELRRKLQNEKVSRLRHAQADMFPTLASKLARFTSDNEHRIKAARPVIPEALNDRAQDNWEPLLAIADCAGGHWPETARKVALKISGGEQESLSTGAELLADIKAAFDQDHSMRLGTATLIERLCSDDMAPWVTWNRGKPLSPRQLANRLGDYDIRVRKLRIDGSPLQGFERSQFEDAWARYLAPLDTPVLSGTPEQVSNFNNLNVPDTHICSGTDDSFGTANILINNNCSGVPYANPVLGENTWEVEL